MPSIGDFVPVHFIRGVEGMRATFGDCAALAEFGCTSRMCVPVRRAGRRLGSMNFDGDEGRHTALTAALAQPFATLAVPAFLATQVA
jgi:hypothetical protein